MKKERNGRSREKQIIKKKKRAIAIVVFMSKGSYCKVWEGVKLTAKNEMLFYLPRTMEK